MKLILDGRPILANIKNIISYMANIAIKNWFLPKQKPLILMTMMIYKHQRMLKTMLNHLEISTIQSLSSHWKKLNISKKAIKTLNKLKMKRFQILLT
jgi:hypothetical protein